MSSEQQQRQTLIELIKRSSPTRLERLYHLLVGMSESWEDDERWHRHRIWHRHGATLDLSEEEFQVAVDFVIVRQVGQSDPEPTVDEPANHDRFANPDRIVGARASDIDWDTSDWDDEVPKHLPGRKVMKKLDAEFQGPSL